MSFHHMSLSSDEEEDLEEWNRREHGTAPDYAGGMAATPMPRGATANSFVENDFDKKLPSDDSDSDDDSIVWEDGDDGEEEEKDGKPPATVEGQATQQPALRQVTVDLDSQNKPNKDEPPKKKRKFKKRNKFRSDSLPKDLQSLLQNLHRSHLLTIVSRACFISAMASESESMAIGLSLVPHAIQDSLVEPIKQDFGVPTMTQLQQVAQWYCSLVHQARRQRQARIRENIAAGAPLYSRQRSRTRRASKAFNEAPAHSQPASTGASMPDRQSSYALYLANSVADDPRFGEESPGLQETRWNALDQIQLLLSILRSLGWRARFVLAMDPIQCDLDVNHPLLTNSRDIFQILSQKKSKKLVRTVGTPQLQDDNALKPSAEQPSQLGWIEVLCRDARQPNKLRWIHVDPSHQLINQPDQVEMLLRQVLRHDNSTKCAVLAYAIAVEHFPRGAKFTDVTPRYAHSFVASLRRRGWMRGRKSKTPLSHEQLRKTWWGQTIQSLNQHFYLDAYKQDAVELQSKGATMQDAIAIDSSDDEAENDKKPPAVNNDLYEKADQAEKEELKNSALDEAIPTSKAAFQTHPLYVLESLLGNAEVLVPDASKRVCGLFKGQLIYRRSDVSTAYPERKWPYLGRQVRPDELGKPIKQVKARKKPVSKNFKSLQSYGVGTTNDGSAERRMQDILDASQPLEDGMERLYAKWQTDPWSPAPVSPTDVIPVNQYKNVELELLNPGLVHIDIRGIAKVAKKLGIPYAPCMLGFEGQGGNRVPTVRGIVVHAHNEMLLREAGAEVSSHALEQEHSNRRRLILTRWKKIVVGVLTKDRIEREYGDTK